MRRPGFTSPAAALVETTTTVFQMQTALGGLAIADVSGKGMQAALLMATLRAGLHSEVTRKKDLPSMAEALNSLLYASSTSGKFATFFYAQLHPETDQITSINAGHNYPLVIRSEGGCDELEKGG